MSMKRSVVSERRMITGELGLKYPVSSDKDQAPLRTSAGRFLEFGALALGVYFDPRQRRRPNEPWIEDLKTGDDEGKMTSDQ